MLFNNNVAKITESFYKMVEKLEKVEVRSLQRISDSQALIRAANEYIEEQQKEVKQARHVTAKIRELIGE